MLSDRSMEEDIASRRICGLPRLGWGWFALSALALLFLGGCFQSSQFGSTPVERNTITVGAASDLQFAFAEIGTLFEKQTGSKPVFAFGSSGNLASQIENGAPIDVFAAANAQFVDDLKSKNLIVEDSRRLYAIGRLVLAVKKDAGLDIRSVEDLARPEVKRIAIANPTHAPYGMAAREVLQNAGLWEQVSSKLVLGENISQAVQFVKTGNAEAGLVALSLSNTPEMVYTLIPEDKYQRMNQAMAVVKTSKNQGAARDFVDFVGSPEAQRILKKHGFGVPGET